MDTVLVVGAVSQDEVRSNIQLFVNTMQFAMSFMPLRVQQVYAAVKFIFEQEWFVQLVTYVINTFIQGDTSPTSADIAEVLKFYADRIGIVGAQPPLVFEKS